MVNQSGISFGGLGSGLDTQAIISQLVALERIPIQQLQAERSENQNKIDRLGQFQTLVNSLSEKAESFSSLAGFLSLSIDGGDESVATIAAGEDAIQGSHTLEVTQLASVDRWAFDAVADPSTDLSSIDGQSLRFTVGTTNYDIMVNADESSLDDLAEQINETAGDDVSASVVNTGTTSNPSYQLVVASRESGEDGRIFNLDSTIDGLNIDASSPDGQGNPTSVNNITVGLNAVAKIDGLQIERSSNDFSDVLVGVTLQAVGLGTTEFGVEADREGMKTQMEEFISAYNDVIDFISTENTFTPGSEEGEAGDTGILFGETALTSVRRELTNSLFNVSLETILGDTEGFSTLSNVGITQDQDGRLSLDSSVFEEKITQDLDKLADLFVDRDGFERDPDAEENTSEYYEDTTADSGLFNSLVRNLDRLAGSLPSGDADVQLQGIFDLRKETLQGNIDRMDERIETKERALEDFRQNLVLRYAKLEEIIGGLNTQGAALNAALFPSIQN